MAKDPSIAIIRGRLAADPELRATGNNVHVVSLRILSSGFETDNDGNKVDVTPTSWKCEAWRDLALHIAQSLRRGSQITAVARPKTETYTDRNGDKRWSTKWVIEDIGASLRTATVQISRTAGHGISQTTPTAPPAQAPASDPYAGIPAPSIENDPWD